MQLLHYCVVFSLITSIQCDYWVERMKLIKREKSLAVGSNLKLTDAEEAANTKLMKAKFREMKQGFLHPESFPPARHFFEARRDIETSQVFKFISQMPKGGALHIHDIALCSTDYVIKNITYRDNLFGCVNNNSIKLKFMKSSPDNSCWKSVKSIRENAISVEIFDNWLASKFSLTVDKPYEVFPDLNTVWKAFINIFGEITPMITYKPVFKDYFYKALEEFKSDNVNYVEVRGTLPEVYDLDGTIYNSIEVLGILKQVADEFLSNNKDFIGVKYIYAPSRKINNVQMDEYLKNFEVMKKLYPDFLLGFDLVGQEDLGQPLNKFVNQLTSISSDIKFYFHAGETNWNGMSTDLNLVDAVLLNTTRIGHGYALLKHPEVLKLVKQNGIAIEINPISNQVLNLVKDLRNHPASVLLAGNYPVVISSDDPGFWNAQGLSHDFYEAFMGLASYNSDLRLLKQLALNSLIYSSLSDADKKIAFTKFFKKWNAFIFDVNFNDSAEDISVFNV